MSITNFAPSAFKPAAPAFPSVPLRGVLQATPLVIFAQALKAALGPTRQH